MENPMFRIPEDGGESQPRPPRRRSEAQEQQRFVDTLMYLLTAPFIHFTGWGEDLGQRHQNNITLERFKNYKEIFENQVATEFEAMLYLSSASFEHPMNHDFAEIYLYLFRRWNPAAAEAAGIGDPQLDPNQLEQMNRLRRWIFRQQMNHLKAQGRQANQKEVAEEKQRLADEQPRMFE